MGKKCYTDLGPTNEAATNKEKRERECVCVFNGHKRGGMGLVWIRREESGRGEILHPYNVHVHCTVYTPLSDSPSYVTFILEIEEAVRN